MNSMKKKLFVLALALLIFGGYFGYNYVFKGPRDVKNESAEFITTAVKLKADFSANQLAANTKYIGKAIILSGIVTEKSNNTVTLDNGVVCIFSSSEKTDLKLGSKIKIKGKVDGYDDLFGQVKLTECSLESYFSK